MGELEKKYKRKKIWGIILFVISILTCIFIGYFSGISLYSHLTAENEGYKFGMLFLFIPFYVIGFISFVCDIISIVLQSGLKEKRSLTLYILSFLLLILILGLITLFTVVLFL